MLPDSLKDIALAVAVDTFDPAAITGGKVALNEVTLLIDPARIVPVCRFLREQQQFNRLSSVTALDRYPRNPRFEIVYHLHSLARNERVRLKCPVHDAIDSVVAVYPAADWYEREVFDLFGVSFRNHPNLKRLLMPEDWLGHPLRKDYPVHGHKYSYQNE